MDLLPKACMFVANFIVSVRRIQKILDIRHYNRIKINNEYKNNISIYINDIAIHKENYDGNKLYINNLLINKIEFIGIICDIGSGKSTLLNAILCENN